MNHLAPRILASLLLLQTAGAAHADPVKPAPPAAPPAAPTKPAPPAANPPTTQPAPSFEGVGQIAEITRQAGGALYRLDLAKPIPLTAIKVKPSAGRVRIASVTLVTDKKDRVPVKNLTNITVTNSDQPASSEALSADISVATIEIQAEAMGGVAALDVKAISSKEAPQLALREEFSCTKKSDAALKEKLDIVQVWAGRAEAAVPGSIQEKYATKEFNRYVNDFITTLRSLKTSFISTEYTLTMVNFFVDRHNASRPDSAADVAYKNMANETFDVFLGSLQTEGDQSCRPVTSDGLVNIALDFQKKFDTNKQDSRARKMYESMIGKLAKVIPVQYRKELAAKNFNFRQADAEGYKFYKLFNTSKPETLLKATYQEMSVAGYALADQALRREVKDMDSEKRYQLIVEFQAKYNDAANYPQDIMMKYLLVISEDGTLFHIVR